MRRKSTDKPLESYRHKSSKRANLPTEQTEPYMKDEQKASVMYIPPARQAGLEPRLSWDRDPALEALETASYPLYIHEKVHPSIFVNELRRSSPEDQTALWDQFNGLPDNAAYEWYKHQGNWQNRLIRGASARVMGSLLDKEGMGGNVQMIYFDPPYGISFDSNFQASTRSTEKVTGERALPNDQATIQAFRDSYRNGIHSYFDNVYRNVRLAYELLQDTGSLFLQIGQANAHRLSIVLDEVFGSANRVATITFVKTGSSSSAKLSSVADFILWYAKDHKLCKFHQLYEPLTRQEKLAFMTWHARLELSNGKVRALSDEEKQDVGNIPSGARIYKRVSLDSMKESNTGRSDAYNWNGNTYPCPRGRQWSVSHEGLDRLAELNRLDSTSQGRLRWKKYENEYPGREISNVWAEQMQPRDAHYVVETATSAIQRCMLMSTDPGDLVLDPTCGAGTTAFVAEKWGRRWISIDTSGVAISLARQRILTGCFEYYHLQDSPEGEQLASQLLGAESQRRRKNHAYDLAKGFVYGRIPNITPASLAYGKDEQHRMLVDQPYVKQSVIRVSSPFTVESESPYRYVSPNSATGALSDLGHEHAAAVMTTLEVSGISGGGGKLRFADIITWSDKSAPYITHLGSTSAEGNTAYSQVKRAAIAIAPSDMTISSAFVNKAAMSALNLTCEIDALVTVGYEYEAATRAKTIEHRGKLKIFKVQANRDLLIGNLKDAQSDNAFVMIGEPDIDVSVSAGNRLVIEVLGFDTYNPSTGNIVQGGGKDIDCWMIDTNYNGESFFARRIHFPNKSADKQIARLKRAIGAKLDRAAWDAMLSYKSLPFDRPSTGQIAVRIVTNTHTEMTTVIDFDAV